ncbi:hypothetical protein DHL47_04440 [Streptococcus panodentis]|uniref:Uncharacterized protein n=1 Tax=Streptococcus panodentis TaxID=1581472 RepID=A0ABS5AVJ5_9STRE|nr:hypothetical protein [Streptococcus panodentis]
MRILPAEPCLLLSVQTGDRAVKSSSVSELCLFRQWLRPVSLIFKENLVLTRQSDAGRTGVQQRAVKVQTLKSIGGRSFLDAGLKNGGSNI